MALTMKAFLSEKSTRSFRVRKPECLDWKKIASLDIEKIIEETDEETLKDILPQIAFCLPDVEFDHNRTDPGFRKVFKLGQLIIEHLIESQERALEKITFIENKNTELMEQNKGHDEEIQRLREKLAEAKKELKRRKEMIETNQNEILGAQNKDEYDQVNQCPYCTKKFINLIYLYSHLQRRHQGLPIHPALNFPSQGGIGPIQIESGPKIDTTTSMKDVRKIEVAIQTDIVEEENAGRGNGTWKSTMDNQTLNTLIEQYLQERMPNLITPHASQPVLKNNSVTNNSFQNIDIHQKPLSGSSQKGITDMKDELETQWRSIIEKMHKTELEDLKETLLDEMHKMKEIILKSNVKVPEPEIMKPATIAPKVSPSPSIAGRVEERFRKQEDDLEHLKQNLQTKIRTDIELIESRLESQERFWRSKLRHVEEEYQEHITKLRNEFQTSNSPKPIEVPSNKVTWPSEDVLVTYKPQTPFIFTLASNQENGEKIGTPIFPPPVIGHPIPKPKPRISRPVIQVLPKADGVKEIETLLKGVKNDRLSLKSSTPAKTMLHEYVEPDEIHHNKMQDPITNHEEAQRSESESLSIGTYSPIQPQKLFNQPLKLGRGSTTDDTITSRNTQIDQIEINANFVMNQPRVEAMKELKDQLEELGVNPESTELPRKNMKKSLKKLKSRRETFTQRTNTFLQDREKLKIQTNQITNAKILEGKVNTIREARRLSSKSKVNANPTSPLVKMFRVVKSGGTSLKQKLSKIGSTKKSKVTAVSPRPHLTLSPTIAGTTIKKPAPSRKPRAPPPPPSHVPLRIIKKKEPSIRTFFRRPWSRKKDESRSPSPSSTCSESEEEERTRLTLHKSNPIKFNTTPKPVPTQQTTFENNTKFSTPNLPKSSTLELGHPKRLKELYDKETELIINRKLDIQRNAEKAIKLCTQAVMSKGPQASTIPGSSSQIKKPINRNLIKEFENSNPGNVYSKYPAPELHSSAIVGNKFRKIEFSASISSLSESATSDTEEEESQGQSVNVKKITPKKIEETEKSKGGNYVTLRQVSKPTPPKIQTVIYHEPMAGLNKFGLKLNSEHNPPDTSHSHLPGTKNLKRLQRRNSKTSSSSDSKSVFILQKPRLIQPNKKQNGNKKNMKQNDDTLNNPSDWDKSVTE